MKILPCDQCNATMINSVYCHETGCPNSTQDPIRMDYDYYADIVSHPGKFEGCPTYVPHFWNVYLDGMADRDGGKVLGFDVDKSDKQMFPELKKRRTVNLIETAEGFVREV